MRSSRLLPLLLAGSLLAVPAVAQHTDYPHQAPSRERISFDKAAIGESSNTAAKRFWVGIFDMRGIAQTCIKLDSIVSVSLQSYYLDDDVAITECTIDTAGNNSIRIYGSRLAQNRKTRDRLNTARDAIDSETGNRYPSKKFPEGAYSHNVEFQLGTAEHVKQVYQSVLNAWVTNEGCIFRIN